MNYPLQALLSALEERQRECRLYMDTVGDILRQHLPNMGIYLVPFPFFRTVPIFIQWSGILCQRRNRYQAPADFADAEPRA